MPPANWESARLLRNAQSTAWKMPAFSPGRTRTNDEIACGRAGRSWTCWTSSQQTYAEVSTSRLSRSGRLPLRVKRNVEMSNSGLLSVGVNTDRSTGKNFVSSSFRVVSPISPRLGQNDSENLSVQFSRRSPASSFATWLWSPDIRTPALCSDERLTAHALRVRRSIGGRQGHARSELAGMKNGHSPL